jgi:hypothetical protein
MAKVQTRFTFRGYHGIRSDCELTIWQVKNQYVVILTNIEDGLNHGTSVTNACEIIASKVLQEYSYLTPENTVWIEHYPRRGRFEESYDEITFQWEEREASSPTWKHMTESELVDLVKDAD